MSFFHFAITWVILKKSLKKISIEIRVLSINNTTTHTFTFDVEFVRYNENNIVHFPSSESIHMYDSFIVCLSMILFKIFSIWSSLKKEGGNCISVEKRRSYSAIGWGDVLNVSKPLESRCAQIYFLCFRQWRFVLLKNRHNFFFVKKWDGSDRDILLSLMWFVRFEMASSSPQVAPQV